MYRRDGDGEQAPGDGVTDTGRGQAQRPDLRSDQTMFVEDPDQHGERGDARRNADEQQEWGQRHTGGTILPGQDAVSQQDPAHDRYGDHADPQHGHPAT